MLCGRKYLAKIHKMKQVLLLPRMSNTLLLHFCHICKLKNTHKIPMPFSKLPKRTEIALFVSKKNNLFIYANMCTQTCTARGVQFLSTGRQNFLLLLLKKRILENMTTAFHEKWWVYATSLWASLWFRQGTASKTQYTWFGVRSKDLNFWTPNT